MNPRDQDDAALEPEPSAEERAEAEALARALEARAPGAAPPPDDALATAALLRHARRSQDPSESARDGARIAAAEARVLPVVDRRRPRPRRWLLPALLVPAGAAAALMAMVTLTPRSAHYMAAALPVAAPVIPKPPTTLLEAQANAAHAGGDLSALDRQMRDYRRAYYAAVGGGDVEEP